MKTSKKEYQKSLLTDINRYLYQLECEANVYGTENPLYNIVKNTINNIYCLIENINNSLNDL